MKNLIRLSIAILIAIVISSCGTSDKGGMSAGKAAELPVIEIPTRTVTAYKAYPASIEGTVNSAIRAKVPGYISEVLVDEGQKVREGQILFRLETESLTQEAAAAQANISAAEVEVNKLKPLIEKGIISEVQLETAKARLAQAKAAYKSIAANIGYANINSPVDGYVGAIPFRIGTLVSPSDPTPLTVVSATDSVYAYFAMNEVNYLDFIQNAEGKSLNEKLKNFPPVQLKMANGELYPSKGKIEAVTGQVNPSTGTVSFRAVFPNENRLLANGSSGTILVPTVYQDAVVVPEVSTYERQGRVYVYEVIDSLALTRSIEIQQRVGNLAVVSSGIKSGATIVYEGVGKLRDSTGIIPNKISFDSIANSLEPVFK